MDRLRSGNAVVSALLVLAVLAGAGAWNYQRNVAREEAEAGRRPFGTHSDEALAQLLAAYEAQHGRDSSRLEAAQGRRAEARHQDYFQDQVDEFARVQRVHDTTRAIRAEVAATQVTLKDLRAEKRLRDKQRDRVTTFLKRVFTI